MRTGFLALLLALPIIASASDDLVKVPFLFTDDQAAPQSDPAQTTPRSDALRTDPYLNAPMTRLEYMLVRMDSVLNEEGHVAGVLSILRQKYDRHQAPPFFEKVRGFATYVGRVGRIVVGYDIDNMGRPKSPMRESCEEVLKYVGFWLPHEPRGYILHNTVLGVLLQLESEAYTPMLEKLAANFVHRVQISSVTEDSKVFHVFACQRTTKDGPVTYNKYSYRLTGSGSTKP